MEKNEKTAQEIAEKLDNSEFSDFFGSEEQTKPEEKNTKQTEETTNEEVKKEPEMEPFEVPDDSFDVTNVNGNERYFNNVYDNFRELGILTNAEELEKDKILTEDELVSILENDKKNAARKIFEDEFLSKFADDDAREYLQYVINGGNSSDFFRQRISSPALDINGDISDERVQNKIISKYLSEFNGMDDEEISEQLQMLSDSGKKEKYANMYLGKIKSYDEVQKENLRRENEIREAQERENYRMMIDTYSNELNSTDNILGVRCDDSKRSRIMDMMFKPVKLNDGSVNTEFNVRLANAIQNPKTMIILADLLANDFDINKYSKSIETQVTKKIKRGLDTKPNIKKNQTSPFDGLF